MVEPEDDGKPGWLAISKDISSGAMFQTNNNTTCAL
jgi:hypothetical protein